MTLTIDQVQGMSGNGALLDRDGDKVGAIGQIYLDDTTGAPSWVTAKTGLFGSKESFVPLEGARQQGSDLIAAYDKTTIKDAPRVDADGQLSPAEEQELFRHYGLSSSGYSDVEPQTQAVQNTAPVTRSEDSAMTRSEEQVRVGTQTRETGRAVLRKHIVTENVSQTVPVSHEEAKVVHEPITPENYDRSVDGPEITEAVHEVTLHEEVPVVDKKVVPVERVRLNTETVTEQQTVSTDVRKEQIETVRDTTSPRR